MPIATNNTEKLGVLAPEHDLFGNTNIQTNGGIQDYHLDDPDTFVFDPIADDHTMRNYPAGAASDNLFGDHGAGTHHAGAGSDNVFGDHGAGTYHAGAGDKFARINTENDFESELMDWLDSTPSASEFGFVF